MAENIMIRKLSKDDKAMLKKLQAITWHGTNSKALLVTGHKYIELRDVHNKLEGKYSELSIKHDELVNLVTQKAEIEKSIKKLSGS